MKPILFATLLLVPFILAETDMPIIGILAMESYAVDKYFPGENYESFIAAQYVKFVEAAGARAVPVWIGKSSDYYSDIIKHTNGLLLPGGATFFNETDGFAVAGKILYSLAMDMNNKGEYYPIFGICLGMELMLHVANDGEELRTNCLSKNVALPLDFTEGYASSRLFSAAPKEIISILKHDNVTYNYHKYCITKDALSPSLNADWQIMSTNYDIKNIQFISSLEHRRYPFYGVQFHPEKVYVHKHIKLNIPHSMEAIKASQFFANFFVSETRKNNNAYPSWTEEQKALIYNYCPLLVKMTEGSSEQLYMFK